MSWLKDNLPVIILVIGLFIGYAELRLPSMVADEMAKRGLVTNGELESIHGKIDAVDEKLSEQKQTHKDDRDRMDGKIERIVDILLED